MLLRTPRTFANRPHALIPCHTVAQARQLVQANRSSKILTPEEQAMLRTLNEHNRLRIAMQAVKQMNPIEARHWTDDLRSWPDWARNDAEVVTIAMRKADAFPLPPR